MVSFTHAWEFGLGLQIPPSDPESWCLQLLEESVAEAVAKYARREYRDDWL